MYQFSAPIQSPACRLGSDGGDAADGAADARGGAPWLPNM
eukprot:SAG11_NODE_30129_length_304_cov_0.463415_2_plen_39_part_01